MKREKYWKELKKYNEINKCYMELIKRIIEGKEKINTIFWKKEW